MATISETKASLRIIGDDLLPEDISNTLGGFPTFSQVKGQEIKTKSGKIRIAKSGMWRLSATEQMPGDLDAQVSEILGQLTNNINSWQELADNYSIDLFVAFLWKSAWKALV